AERRSVERCPPNGPAVGGSRGAPQLAGASDGGAVWWATFHRAAFRHRASPATAASAAAIPMTSSRRPSGVLICCGPLERLRESHVHGPPRLREVQRLLIPRIEQVVHTGL